MGKTYSFTKTLPELVFKVYHGSDVPIEIPRLGRSKRDKDFGKGFYTTLIIDQATRWASRFETPCVSEYLLKLSSDLKVLEFKRMTEEWLDLIVAFRTGKEPKEQYDIIIGPMADDQIYNAVKEYIQGVITREALWALSRFNRPTNQICFKTQKALDNVEFIQCIKE